jgi:hypothetical protein
MDSNRYVPLSLIASFPKVQAISNDIKVVKSALSTSRLVELDAVQESIRAKQPRNILLVRNVTTTAESPVNNAIIKAALDSKPEIQNKIVYIKQHNSSFTVTFADDKSCADALAFLPTQTVNGVGLDCVIQPTTPVFLSGPRQNFYPPGTAGAGYRRAQAPQQPRNQQPQRPSQQPRNPQPQQQPQQRQQSQPQSRKDTSTAAPVDKVGYQGSFIKYDRQTVAKVINNFVANPPKAPASFLKDGQPICPIITTKQHTTTTLLHPIPVMFPASPSPEMAIRQPEVLPPFLQLGQPSAPAVPSATVQPLPALVQPITMALSSNSTSSTFTSSALFQTLNLTSSAVAAPTATQTIVPLTALPPLAPPQQQSQKDKKQMTAESATFVPRAKDGVAKTTSKPANKDAKGNNAKQQPKQQAARVDPKKRAALDKSAFPSSFGPAKTTTTTTTKSVLDFAATVAQDADPADVQLQQQQLAAKKKARDEAEKATKDALAAAAAAATAVPEGEDKDAEKKQAKGKKAKKDKSAEKGDEKKDKQQQQQQPKKDKQVQDKDVAAKPVQKKEKPVEKVVDAAPAGSWAAMMKNPESAPPLTL